MVCSIFVRLIIISRYQQWISSTRVSRLPAEYYRSDVVKRYSLSTAYSLFLRNELRRMSALTVGVSIVQASFPYRESWTLPVPSE